MTLPKKIRVTSLDYDDIKKSLIEYLKSTDEFTDFNFEGSGLSVIINMLAANAHYQALMANFVFNETFLDTSVKRSSIVSRAKELGYIPFSKKSSKATVNIVFKNVAGNPSSLVLPSGTQFSTTVNDTEYTFVTLQSYSANRVLVSGGYQYTFSLVDLYEGVYIENSFTYNSIDPTLTIPNIDIDTSTLRVFVTEPDSTDEVEYTFAVNLSDVDSQTTAFFVQEGYNSEYQIYFGDGIIGKQPSNSSTVRLSYLATNGAQANDAISFFAVTQISGAETSSVTCSIVNASSGGRERESSESIKLNASNSFGVQNRAVTANDYKSIIKSAGINLKDVHVWGGESNNPPKYGYVFVCALPTSGDFLLQSHKNTITELLKTKSVPSIKIEFANPEYLDIMLNVNVEYNKNVLDISTYDLETAVFSTVLLFADDNVNRFNSTFRFSNLMREIDRTDSSILSNTTTVKLKKSIVPTLYTNNSYIIQFDNVLDDNLKTSTISSSQFTVADYPQNVYLEDDGAGSINMYTTTNNKKTLLQTGIGSVDYATGKVNIQNITITGYDGYSLDIVAIPLRYEVTSKNNTVLRIRSEDVSVSSVAG